MGTSFNVIILAAGKGKRMGSDLPKVAHAVAGAPMISWVVQACQDAGCARIAVVVGHQQDVVRDLLAESSGSSSSVIEFAVQEEQLGTGHAVRCAEHLFPEPHGEIIVLAGDGPLVRAQTLKELVNRHRATGASATLATACVDDPAGYGRVLRDKGGHFVGVVEDRDATADQRAIHEINPSVYCFNAADLFSALPDLSRSAPSDEYYLTDVPALLAQRGKTIEAVNVLEPEEGLSINTPEQLDAVSAILAARLTEAPGG